MHVPLLQGILGLAPVSLSEWLGVVGLALTTLVVGEAYKVLRARPLAAQRTIGRP
jgi:hypothetical protein